MLGRDEADPLTVSQHQDDEETAELKRVSAELADSLALCRFMLAEARAHLIATPNEHPITEGNEELHSP